MQCNKWTLRNQTYQYAGDYLMSNVTQPVILEYDYKSESIQHLEIRLWTNQVLSSWPDYPN